MHWRLLRVFAALALGMAWALPATAQTVRPVIVEYKGRARGKFELVNNSLQPVSVVVEPRCFTITEDGKGVNEPLSSNIHLKLSAMSLRIPPKQSRFVFYKASADHLPAWFILYSTFALHPMPSGLNVHISLPHTVYLLQKQPLQRGDVSVESCRYMAEKRRIRVLLSNKSTRLGRVLRWWIGNGRSRQSGSGFPLLPNSQRRLTMAWKLPDAPRELTFRFQHFALKEELPGREP